MRRFIDLGFFLIVAVACAGLDFYIQRRDHGGAGFGLAEYVALRQENWQDVLHPPSLRAALPSDVAGWEMTASTADVIVTGSPESRAQQASEVAMVKAVAALEKASSPSGDMIGMTMTKGDTRLRMVATLRNKDAAAQPAAANATETPETIQTAAKLQTVFQTAAPAADKAAYAVVDGVAFTELPAAAIGGDPSLRMMRAELGDQISVTVVTKSSDDAAIKEAMAAIDFVMLNKLLQNPLAGVADGRADDMRQDPESADILASGAGISPDAPEPLAALLPTQASQGGATQSTAPPALRPQPSDVVQVTPTPTAAAKAGPAETAVFVAAPAGGAATPGRQPCVRRAGVLVCPEG